LEDRREETRVSSVRRIVEAAKSSEMPLVAVGDFNSTPSSFPQSQSTSAGENAMDLLIESNQFNLNADKLPTQQEMTYPAVAPTRVIDWILIPTNWQFADYRVISSPLSDHRPVVADLQLRKRDPE
jgi:endonuclease/exonuclease/phosphatase family metal-dependent hydrolase